VFERERVSPTTIIKDGCNQQSSLKLPLKNNLSEMERNYPPPNVSRAKSEQLIHSKEKSMNAEEI
jgi:hypothetical protein